MLKLNNIRLSKDYRKHDLKAKNKEIFKDTHKICTEVQEKFNRIFLLITIYFWNRKIEDSLDKTQNAF